MTRVAVAAALLAVACDDVSQDDTVFKCDTDNPCPGAQVCSGASGICLDHAVLFYEDFEGGLDASTWFVTEQMGSVGVDESAPHWGEAALLATSTTGGGAVGIRHTFDAPLPSTLFLRLFIQQANANAYTPYFLLDNAAGSVALNAHGEQSKVSYKVTRDATTVTAEGGNVSSERWTCYEVEVTGPASGDGDGTVKLYIDDVEQTAMQRTVPLRAFERLELGGYSMAPIQTLFDDVILDTQRVGCSR